MNTKLTLRLDKDLIDRAKAYGLEHGKSVSELVGDYFTALEAPTSDVPITPLVARLRGIAKDAEFSKEAYHEHLAKKYFALK